ncbi:unnamed protein product [Penicillium salamii]|nr:unnamed protein product [Penicillium salamii]CAG8274646.1 unnamed protein product [Penicillium salamii]CAG8428216.1 unnamed protein product [Penicillium salamii]
MAHRPVIDYYFSFISLWSYVGNRHFEQLAKDTNAQVIFKPIDLLYTFSTSGGLPVKQRATQRQIYRLLEMERWKKIRNIPLVNFPKFYPADPSLAHRVLLAAIKGSGSDSPNVKEFVHKGLEAVWARELDIANPETITLLANEAGLDGEKLLRKAYEDKELAEEEKALTAEAESRNIFGAPFYVYQGEPIWGQDRLDMLKDIVTSGREPFVPLKTL